MTMKPNDNFVANPKYTRTPISVDEIRRTAEQQAERNPEFRMEYLTAKLVNEIAETVYEMREEAKLTQTELAERINMPQSFIAKLENPHGKRQPTLHTLIKVAIGLNHRLTINFGELEACADQPLVNHVTG